MIKFPKMNSLNIKRCIFIDEHNDQFEYIMKKCSKNGTSLQEHVISSSTTPSPSPSATISKQKRKLKTNNVDQTKKKKKSPYFTWLKMNNDELSRNFRVQENLAETQKIHRNKFVKYGSEIWNSLPQELKNKYKDLDEVSDDTPTSSTTITSDDAY